jgi:hypothetical protein
MTEIPRIPELSDDEQLVMERAFFKRFLTRIEGYSGLPTELFLESIKLEMEDELQAIKQDIADGLYGEKLSKLP